MSYDYTIQRCGISGHCQRAAERIRELEESRDFYKRRCDELQKTQNTMRDPERKMVCDILANGKTYQAPARDV